MAKHSNSIGEIKLRGVIRRSQAKWQGIRSAPPRKGPSKTTVREWRLAFKAAREGRNVFQCPECKGYQMHKKGCANAKAYPFVRGAMRLSKREPMGACEIERRVCNTWDSKLAICTRRDCCYYPKIARTVLVFPGVPDLEFGESKPASKRRKPKRRKPKVHIDFETRSGVALDKPGLAVMGPDEQAVTFFTETQQIPPDVFEDRRPTRKEAAMKWPKHEGELSLTHNAHKSNYETVAEALATGSHGFADDCWVSPEQRAKAIATNECWTLQWYPDTPIGFCIKSAADLAALMEAVGK